MRGLKRFLKSGWLLLGVALIPAVAVAATGSLSHAYQANGQINPGEVVSFVAGKSGYVQAAHANDGARVAGVAISDHGSLLAIDPSTGSVQVAVSGSAPTLVSTLNGPIKVGDQVSVSPLGGLGMKADPASGWSIVGVAQTAFNSSTSGASSREVTKNGGGKTSVSVGYARLSLTLGADINGGGLQLNRLQELFKNFAGRTISTARIVVAIVVTTMALLALSVLMYASIQGSLVALGRNPLAKFSIFRSLRSIFGVSLLILAIAALTDVFLLR
jgi:hypothetical protein